MGTFDVRQALVVGLGVGLLAWVISRRSKRRLEELTDRRIRETSALIEHADGLFWEAEVELSPKDWIWRMTLHHSVLCRKLFDGRMPVPGVDLWTGYQIDNREEMNRRCRDAVESGQPGYTQEFQVTREGLSLWLNENVSITPVAPNRFWLVGLVTDITQRREAEAGRQQSELTVERILQHAHCMLWRAKVVEKDGVLDWQHFDIPKSQVSNLLFGERAYSAERGFWETMTMPEQAEMNERSSQAIRASDPGYVQEFRAIDKTGRLYWLHERVTILRVADKNWSLVGVVTDVTSEHDAEEAQRESESRLALLLERADTMLWQARVERRADDTHEWTMYIPESQLYRRIFSENPVGSRGFAWEEREVSEHAEMQHRSFEAIASGAPGYQQVFHVHRPEGDIWLSEKVTIVATGPERWDLVGIISDITARHLAEEAWQASQARLGKLLELADCLVWEARVMLLPDDTLQWDLNTQRSVLYRRIFGDRDETELNWHTLNVPEFAEMKVRALRAVKAGAAGYSQEFHVVLPDESIWLREVVTMRQLSPGAFQLVGVITDITAETARAASDARLQEILTRADCLLWEAKVTLTDWSWHNQMQPSGLCRKLFGELKPGRELGLWRDFNIPEQAAMDERCRLAIQEGRAGYDQVFHIVKDDHAVIWLSETVTIRRISEDKFSLVGVAVDITAQRGAEEALAAEKERLAVTLRAMSECVVTTDVAGLVQFMNPAAAILTGWDAPLALGRPIAEICRLQSIRTDESVEVPIARVARGDAVVDLPPQTRLVTRSGGHRQVNGCCAPIHTVDSKVIGTVFVFRDVTEQERLEQELVRATRLESVGVLAGGIAHDFNNILTAVMGNLALAQLDIAADSPAGASLRSAEKAALRARDLTQQLLTFAKGGEPVRAAVQLVAIVREMAGFALHGSQVKASYDMAPDLWPADADKGQIGRVVQNLVINAVQAMPRGGILRIMARNDAQDGQSQPGLKQGDYIQIAITDTGEGIKPDHLARIFDPYFTTKQTGTGLGLAAVYSIVKKHHGHIEVESQIGQGTTFRIWLPALRQQLASDTRAPWSTPDRMTGRVLFMDDEQSIRDMAVMLLQRFGLAVDCAVDGAEAVGKYRAALAEGRRYDLVIMDLTVPGGMGGLAALGQLREIDASVRAVVSSGYSSDPVLANYRAHGFVAVIAKPYEVNELSRVLREVLAGA